MFNDNVYPIIKEKKTILIHKSIVREGESETYTTKESQSPRTSKASIDPIIHAEKDALPLEFSV